MTRRPAYKLYNLAGRLLLLAVLLVALSVNTASAFDYVRLQNYSLAIGDTTPGATTSYTMSWRYPSGASLGSIRLLLCTDPYVLDPCTVPTDASFANAVLSSQSGAT